METNSSSESRPLMIPRLQRIISTGVEVSTVLDVGVQASTDFLIACFPDVPHILFEPVDSYFPAIRERYANMQSELIHVALSDVDGTAWQIGVSRDGSGRVTHSYLNDVPVSQAELPEMVECKPVRKARLDTILDAQRHQAPYLLKVDVDGHEIPILNGARKTFRDVSILIVEAAVRTIRPKLDLLETTGFQLLDIVDPCYYHGILSQVDLIFVHSDWIGKCDDLRPWETKQFSWDAWKWFK